MQTTPQDFTTPTLYLAFELGGSNWQLAFAVEPAGPVRHRALAASSATSLLERLSKEIADARRRFRLDADTPVRSVYEAGRDGFWLHRALTTQGVANVIIEPASLRVDRRARRAKTDRLDLQELLASLFRHHRGERVWRVVRVPDSDVEDLRRLSRRRERLVKEQTQHTNRIKGLLNQEGIKARHVLPKNFDRELDSYRRFDGTPLGEQLLTDVRDELARLRLVQAQLKAIKDEQRALLRQEAPASPVVGQAQRLVALKGIGAVSAFVLSGEFFAWRDFKNRRQVGALAGLTDSPWKSDGIDRQQGISKAGNRRVRTLAIELAWGWLRWQPDSALSQWFKRNAGNGKKRFRRVAIVALARKLLVALWHYLDHGLVPDGAIVTA
jgi:transposase